MAAESEHGTLDPALAPAAQDSQLVHGNWGIGVSQETRPEGISYRVRVCYRRRPRYLGRFTDVITARLAYDAAVRELRPTAKTNYAQSSMVLTDAAALSKVRLFVRKQLDEACLARGLQGQLSAAGTSAAAAAAAAAAMQNPNELGGGAGSDAVGAGMLPDGHEQQQQQLHGVDSGMTDLAALFSVGQQQEDLFMADDENFMHMFGQPAGQAQQQQQQPAAYSQQQQQQPAAYSQQQQPLQQQAFDQSGSATLQAYMRAAEEASRNQAGNAAAVAAANAALPPAAGMYSSSSAANAAAAAAVAAACRGAAAAEVAAAAATAASAATALEWPGAAAPQPAPSGALVQPAVHVLAAAPAAAERPVPVNLPGLRPAGPFNAPLPPVAEAAAAAAAPFNAPSAAQVLLERSHSSLSGSTDSFSNSGGTGGQPMPAAGEAAAQAGMPGSSGFESAVSRMPLALRMAFACGMMQGQQQQQQGWAAGYGPMDAAGSPATASTAAGPPAAAAAAAAAYHLPQQQQQQFAPIAMNMSDVEWDLLLQRVPALAPQQQQAQHLNHHNQLLQHQQQQQAAFQDAVPAMAAAAAGPAAAPAAAPLRSWAASAAVEPPSIAGARSCEDVIAFVRLSVSHLMQLTVRLLQRPGDSCVVSDLSTWLAAVRQAHAAAPAANNGQLPVSQRGAMQLLRQMMILFMRNIEVVNNDAARHNASVLAECSDVQGLADRAVCALSALLQMLDAAAQPAGGQAGAPRSITRDLVAGWLAALQQQAQDGTAADRCVLQLCTDLCRGGVSWEGEPSGFSGMTWA